MHDFWRISLIMPCLVNTVLDIAVLNDVDLKLEDLIREFSYLIGNSAFILP